MSQVVFKINNKLHRVDGKYGPDFSLNEYIRNVADLHGTKSMCHEGGCGACVVAVRAPHADETKTFAVNSCLVSVLSCHNWEVTTIEGIGNRLTGYHEIQTRLAQFNGTQCGYCSPGWIMNMYSLLESNKSLTMEEIENSFASNMCRCTGYRPIADAFKSFAVDATEKLKQKLCDIEDLGNKPCGIKCKKVCDRKNDINKTDDNSNNDDLESDDESFLEVINNKMIQLSNSTHKWYKVYSLKECFKAMENGDYKLVAGNTGQGVYHVTDYPTNVIDISDVVELKGYVIDVNLVLGAGMTLSEMMGLFLTLEENEDFFYLKEFRNHLDLVAHIPVRNIGTIGGNLFLKHAHNEFPSDLFLLFETVGAVVTVAADVNDTTELKLRRFLKTDLDGKVILNVKLPPLSRDNYIKTFKIMPRAQNAHAIVNAGFLFKFKHNTKVLQKVSIVYGNISPGFIHASKTEAILVGKDPYTDITLQLALKTLCNEIQAEEWPPEPSAAFRNMLAITLYYKAILSLCPEDKINPKYRSGAEVIKRITSEGSQSFETDESVWPLNQPIPKLEGLSQCSGEAFYTNDMPAEKHEVFAAFVTADVVAGSVISEFDTTKAFELPGVIAFYSTKDIPGKNSFIAPNLPLMSNDEEVLCFGQVKYYGQPAGIIVANREKTANKAAKLVEINYESISEEVPLITVADVLHSPSRDERVFKDDVIEPTDIGNDVTMIVNGRFEIHHQYPYYMEPQTCITKIVDGKVEVFCATQWTYLVNAVVAQFLDIPLSMVNVIVRRVGGGYGGKLTRSAQVACACALVTHLQGKTCRFILSIQDSMKIIGKRIPTMSKFEAGLNDEGEIQYLKNIFYQNCGNNTNETITAATVAHFTSCYDTKRWFIEPYRVTTDTHSNAWCRAPFSTEGIAMVENIMDKIAFSVKKDPTEVRLINMIKENNPLPEMIEQIKDDANYNERVEEIKEFNDNNRWRKRGMKLVPIKFHLSYFGTHRAMVTIYENDGSVLISHSGVEMGQGINTKAAQVCAYKLNIPLDKVTIDANSTYASSANCVFTGGSFGSEGIAFCIEKACDIILDRLKPVKEQMDDPTWEELIAKAFSEEIDLQAEHTFSKLLYDVKEYEVYAVCIIEVEIDVLTGNHEIRRVDLLEDTGRSLSPEIDIAQIEGGLVMGLGYWTSEEIVFNPQTGEQLTDRTWNYKPPGIKDIPADFRIYLKKKSINEFGVLQSKGVGEPPFCLATTVIHAIHEAVHAARLEADYEDVWFDIVQPCTVEHIFNAIGHKLEHFKLN